MTSYRPFVVLEAATVLSGLYGEAVAWTQERLQAADGV